MLGLHYVAGDVAGVPGADALKGLLEGIFRRRGIEQGHSVITAERDEMQAALVLIADWFDVHSR